MKGNDGKKFERVIIEMNTNEAKHFVAKLREIERVIKLFLIINIGINRIIIMSILFRS